jgi:formimidoylglutamate deiminase
MVSVVDGRIELPAFTSAHSHAFQRGMRGRAQRPGPAGTDDFWSWRHAMYELAETLDPERIHQLSRVAYAELKRAGVTTVGEFHYVHHQADGTPYEDRLAMSEAVIAAARDEGLRICLARVVYHRAGPDKAAEGVQRRFCDADVDLALNDVEELRKRHAGAEDVRVAIAPHSVRAVPPEWLNAVAAFAERRELLVHMHVAEQPAEIEQCLTETGKRPVELLADRGVLSDRFVAVHATHLTAAEAELLGKAGAFVCLCPTTERDLGDGLPDVDALCRAGARICLGVDSHVLTDPLEDMRAVELGARLKTGRRVVLRPEGRTLAEALWHMGSTIGAMACGFDAPAGTVVIDRGATELSLVRDEDLLDAIVFSGTARLFP